MPDRMETCADRYRREAAVCDACGMQYFLESRKALAAKAEQAGPAPMQVDNEKGAK